MTNCAGETKRAIRENKQSFLETSKTRQFGINISKTLLKRGHILWHETWSRNIRTLFQNISAWFHKYYPLNEIQEAWLQKGRFLYPGIYRRVLVQISWLSTGYGCPWMQLRLNFNDSKQNVSDSFRCFYLKTINLIIRNTNIEDKVTTITQNRACCWKSLIPVNNEQNIQPEPMTIEKALCSKIEQLQKHSMLFS